jgi:hypothetical protein
LVGGLFFLVVLINSQGARSSSEMFAALTAALLQPVPMFLTALAAGYGGRWTRLLAVLLPAVLAVCYLGPAVSETIHRTAFFQFVGYFCSLQTFNVPGATILALLAIGFSVWDASA